MCELLYEKYVNKMNVFVGCGKDKENHRCKAKDLYTGNYFKAVYAYRESLHPDKLYILSGKHYLLKPNQEIEPYNVYLGDFSSEERKEWAEKVIEKMKAAHIDFNAKTYFLAGKDYTEYLIDSFPNAVCPFDKPSLNGMGDIIHWCQSHTKSVKEKLMNLKDYLLEHINDMSKGSTL